MEELLFKINNIKVEYDEIGEYIKACITSIDIVYQCGAIHETKTLKNIHYITRQGPWNNRYNKEKKMGIDVFLWKRLGQCMENNEKFCKTSMILLEYDHYIEYHPETSTWIHTSGKSQLKIKLTKKDRQDIIQQINQLFDHINTIEQFVWDKNITLWKIYETRKGIAEDIPYPQFHGYAIQFKSNIDKLEESYTKADTEAFKYINQSQTIGCNANVTY